MNVILMPIHCYNKSLNVGFLILFKLTYWNVCIASTLLYLIITTREKWHGNNRNILTYLSQTQKMAFTYTAVEKYENLGFTAVI